VNFLTKTLTEDRDRGLTEDMDSGITEVMDSGQSNKGREASF
jgi:hypothetical protein